MKLKKLIALVLSLCVCATMMAPIASATDPETLSSLESNDAAAIGGNEAIKLTYTTLTKQSDGSYKVHYWAKMNMPNALASAAKINNPEKLGKLQFICTLTTTGTTAANAVIADKLNDVTGNSNYTIGGAGSEYYDFVGAAHSGTELKLVYKLKATAANTLYTLAGADDHLTDDVIFEIKDDVVVNAADTALINAIRSSAGITVKATVDIGYIHQDGDSTYDDNTYKQIVEVANGRKVLRDYTESSGSGSPISITETDEDSGKTSTKNGLSNDEVGGEVKIISGTPTPGSIVVFTVNPRPGKRVVSVEVTDGSGKKIETTYRGDGKYEFTMPSGSVKIRVTFEDAPYLPSDTGLDQLLNTDEHIKYTIGDDFGTWRPFANVKRSEIAMMFYRLLRNKDVTPTVSFPDVEKGAWYETAVNVLATVGIFKGNENGLFRPDDNITRAEFAAACVRFASKEPVSPAKEFPFSDVAKSFWGYDEIAKAAAFGWIVGELDGNFYPNNNLTRTEAVTVINRMLGRPGDVDAVKAGKGVSFPDVAENFWGRVAIEESTTEHDNIVDKSTYTETWLNVKNG